jgi:hypothetical protein
MALIWRHPFSAIICGGSGSGKTVFTTKVINQAGSMIQPPPERILYCYGAYQDAYKSLKNVEFRDNVPELTELESNKSPMLLIIDDLMGVSDDKVEKIFTEISHHNDISVMYLTQNLFYGSKNQRTISLNAHYLVLFKNPRDASQITYLARQMFPGKSKHLIEAYRDATQLPFTYLLIDLKPDTDERHRLRSNIFPDETNYVYVAK